MFNIASLPRYVMSALPMLGNPLPAYIKIRNAAAVCKASSAVSKWGAASVPLPFSNGLPRRHFTNS